MGLFRAASLKCQRGSAIVFAMGLSLLVVALSAALLISLSLDIRRVEQLIFTSERLGLIEIAEASAAEKIKKEPEDWQSPWEMKVGETQISAQLEDLSARVNVNTLFARPDTAEKNEFFEPKSVLLRLLNTLSILNGEEILQEIQAQGSPVFGLGEFPGLNPAAHLLYAADSDIQAININTTTPEVLASLLGISTEQASALLSDRPFKELNDFKSVLKDQNIEYEPADSVDAWLGFEGRYYLLETTITQKRPVRIYSVFQKSGETVTLEWRSWEKMP